jgi:hypothetical protein
VSPAEYHMAIAIFLEARGVTRCPTVCAAPTQATIADADRAAYRDYVALREMERRQKLKSCRSGVFSLRQNLDSG